MGTLEEHRACTSLGAVYEDNLFLEPKAGTQEHEALLTWDLSKRSWGGGIIARNNSLVDGVLYIACAYKGDVVDLPITISQNLIVRTADLASPDPSWHAAGLVDTPPWPELSIDDNLYVLHDDRDADFVTTNLAGGASGWAAWQAAGFDAASPRLIQDFTTASPRPDGGRDVFVEYLAGKSGSVSDRSSALALLRNRMPGEPWDDAIHAPLGNKSGLYEYALEAYRPTGLNSDRPVGGGYFGALNYTVKFTQHNRQRPPRITPRQLQRVGLPRPRSR